jgi:hypothetical protein
MIVALGVWAVLRALVAGRAAVTLARTSLCGTNSKSFTVPAPPGRPTLTTGTSWRRRASGPSRATGPALPVVQVREPAPSTTNAAFRAWQGPAGRRDFFAANFSVEVKTSRHRLRHRVSLDQVERPSGDATSCLASLWVTTDPSAGATLPELVGRIESVVDDLAAFEKKLLAGGYGHEDTALYDRRYTVLKRRSSSLPRRYHGFDLPILVYRRSDTPCSSMRISPCRAT